MYNGFYHDKLSKIDPEVQFALNKEYRRQQDHIELIASENYVSQAVLEAQGSIFTNKYAEGYPAKRYYGGCEFVDEVENLAIERLKKLFGSEFANVQPHSGSQANQAVYFSLINHGDKILGLDLNCGGHLTHGAKPNISGKYFEAIHYMVDPETHLIDYDQVRDIAKREKPKLIIAGASAYPRIIDFKIFREIADEVGAYLLVDMAHIAGLVASGLHPSPIPHAHVVTSTTHKTLRGPRGGIILTNDESIAKKINSAIFPGLQGGPLMHVIAAKAVAFKEALSSDFREYSKQVIKNAQVLANTLLNYGFDLVSGGTDNHLILVDLRSKKLTGDIAEKSLERAGLACNKNSVPFDTEKPTITSGIRIGTPAGTSRGFTEAEFEFIGHLICTILNTLAYNNEKIHRIEAEVKEQVYSLCKRFPIY